MSVYTLELEGGNYYVGYSDDMPRRIAEHFLGRGAIWTRIHPPVKVLEVVAGSKELENAKTIALMCRRGWRVVRGGAWVATELKSMPLPMARVLAGKPPRELPDERGKSAYEYREQAIYLREEGDGFVARATGPLAVNSCPGQGVKTFVAESEDLARAAAERWIDDMEGDRRHGGGDCGGVMARQGGRAIFWDRLWKSGVAMTRPWEEILKASTECPMCGKSMTIRNLRYKHRCKGHKGPSEVEQLVNQAREAAVAAHRIRMGVDEEKSRGT
jgi:hypothetical protein